MDQRELEKRRALIPERFRGGAAIDLVDPDAPPSDLLEQAKHHLAELEAEEAAALAAQQRMTIFISLEADFLTVRLPPISEPDGLRGQFVKDIRPGENFRGWSYDALRELSNGKHEIEEKAAMPVT